MELNVVPALSVSLSPALAVIPAPQADTAPVSARGACHGNQRDQGPAKVNVALQLPSGWTAAPASVPLSFMHEDESLSARFEITAPAHVKTGEYTLRAVATSPAWPATRSSPRVRRNRISAQSAPPSDQARRNSLKVVDVKTAPDLNVGYIVGVGDQVPAAIEQLGAQSELHRTGRTGVGRSLQARCDCDRRPRLRAPRRPARLQPPPAGLRRSAAEPSSSSTTRWNSTGEDYGPYPAKVSGNRVADETVPVKVLVPDDPVFNVPNRIGPATWDGWVQERGLYFLGAKDPRYVDLVSMVDSFPDNPGEKLGRSWRRRTAKGHGSTSVCVCGVNCRPEPTAPTSFWQT